jgi:predicted GH43/DUF377 family glycosyl hydrolase
MAKILKKKKISKLKKLFKKKVLGKSKIKKISKKVVSRKKAKIVKKRKKSTKILTRFAGNPIIYPASGKYWEAKATFNPTAFLYNGKVHVIYRAISASDMSTLGYGTSKDGFNISDRTFQPIFIHRNNHSKDFTEPVFYTSGGGGNGGAEDPRITKIDDMLYMTYTAFDGWGSVRIGLTSISLEDFIAKRWRWKKPVLISPPGEIHKNWVIFPEKINGKYAILHNVSPEIMIEYVKDMNSFDGTKFIHSVHQGDPRWQLREKGIRGVGGAPIKTKYGWLIFFHAMEPDEMHRYKLWAMLLDLKDPTKILYRSKKPVLEPDAFYENQGIASGIVYSCGAVVKGEDLFVYYGGADMVTCVATANLELFLKELMTTGITKLKKK